MESKAVSFGPHVTFTGHPGGMLDPFFWRFYITHQRILGTVRFYLYLGGGFTYVFFNFPLRLLGKWSSLTIIFLHVWLYDSFLLVKKNGCLSPELFVTMFIVGVVFSYLHGYLQSRVKSQQNYAAGSDESWYCWKKSGKPQPCK